MASLHIDFSYDDNVKRSINGAKNTLSTRINDYTGIKRNLGSMSSSTGNLSTANTYIQKKINALQSKYEKLEKFRIAVTDFNENAAAADRRVANQINTETKQFYKREGIKTGILYTIGSVFGKGVEWLRGKIEETFDNIIAGAKTLWENIKQWYEDNKHWIDIVVDVVCVVAAIVGIIASGGAAAAVVFGVWGVLKAGTDLIYDSQAYYYYRQGDMEKYEEYSQTGLKNVMAEHLGPGGEFLYYGMEIASAVFSLYQIGTTIKGWGDGAKRFKDVFAKGIGTKNLTTLVKKDGKFVVETLKGIKKWDVYLSNLAFGLKTYKNLVTADNIGVGIVKSIKASKIGWDLTENTYNMFTMDNLGQAMRIFASPILLPTPSPIKIQVNFNLIGAPARAAA